MSINVNGFKKYGLSERLLDAIEAKGFASPTPVQREMLNLDSFKRDVIVRAKTGSGKTLAFLLPIYNEGNLDSGNPKVLILSPTRELALQTNAEACWLGQNQDISTASLVGGMDMAKQIRELRKGASIVIGTPGRTLDHLRQGTLKPEGIHSIILDEGDRMLDMGFKEELEAILQALPKKKRTWLFSATMPEEVMTISKKYLNEPLCIDLVEDENQHSDIEHEIYTVPQRFAFEGLVNVLLWESPTKGLIFCRTKAETMEIAKKLSAKGFKALCLNGDMTQRERSASLGAFKSGQTSLLVATNVAARGLDVPGVDYVVQYGLPDDLETFIHRSGRTGRAGAHGKDVLVLTPQETRHIKQMIGNTKIKAKWLTVPNRNDINKKRKVEYEKDLLGTDEVDEDVLTWAGELLEKSDPVALVAKLLKRTNADSAGGYDLEEELKRELKREPLKRKDSSWAKGKKDTHSISRDKKIKPHRKIRSSDLFLAEPQNLGKKRRYN